MDYDKAKEHIGHRIECVSYGDGDNIAIECVDCNEVIVSVNADERDDGAAQ